MCGGGLAQPVSAHHLLQAALCVCAAMAVRPTEAQLLALPEHSLSQGAAGRVRAAQGPVALPALQAGSFWHSLLREWLPGPLPSWTWSGPGLRLLSSTTFTCFFCGTAEEGQQNKERGQHCPSCQCAHLLTVLPLLPCLSSCSLQYHTFTRALVPFLQSWWYQTAPTCSTPWTARWTSISSCGKKLQSMNRWKWGVGQAWPSPELPNGGAGVTGTAKLRSEGEQGHTKANWMRTVPLLPSSITELQQMNVSVFNFENVWDKCKVSIW